MTIDIDTDKVVIAGDETRNQIKLDALESWPSITFNEVHTSNKRFLGFGNNTTIVLNVNSSEADFNTWKASPVTHEYHGIFRDLSVFKFNVDDFSEKGTVTGTTEFNEDDTTITEPTITTNADYEFLGWTKDTSTNTLISFADALAEWNNDGRAINLNLYPVTKRIWSLTYTVSDDDLDKAIIDFTGLRLIYKTNETASTIYNNKPDSGITRKHGYNFIGWTIDDKLLTEALIQEYIDNANCDVEIIANFEVLNKFTLELDNSIVYIEGDPTRNVIELDSMEDYDNTIVYKNVSTSGKRFLGFTDFNLGNLMTKNEILTRYINWKNTLPRMNLTFTTASRDLNTVKFIINSDYLETTSPTTIVENPELDNQGNVSLPVITAKLGYLFNGEYSLTEGGIALTNHELMNMIGPWDGESSYVLYALYEEDPTVVKARFSIDTNKANVPKSTYIAYDITQFDNIKNTLSSITPKDKYLLDGWNQDGNKYSSLNDVLWDGTSNTVITCLLKNKPSPTPPSPPSPGGGGSGGGGGGGSGGGGGGSDYITILPIVPIHTTEISTKALHIPNPEKYIIVSSDNINIQQYSWATKDNVNWQVIYGPFEEVIKDTWAYLTFGEEEGWYHLDENGYMTKGWFVENGVSFYLEEEPGPKQGLMHTGLHVTDIRTYVFAANGKLMEVYDIG